MSSKDERRKDRHANDSPESRGDELDQRLAQLKSRLDDGHKRQRAASGDADTPQNQSNRAGVAQAFRLSSEFIAGVVVGAGIGYLVDTFFGTSPWGMIVFLLLGFAAAVLNVMRAAGMVAESNMRFRPAQELHKQQLEGETDDTAEK